MNEDEEDEDGDVGCCAPSRSHAPPVPALSTCVINLNCLARARARTPLSSPTRGLFYGSTGIRAIPSGRYTSHVLDDVPRDGITSDSAGKFKENWMALHGCSEFQPGIVVALVFL